MVEDLGGVQASNVDKLNMENSQDTQESIDALYAAQVAIDAVEGGGDGDATLQANGRGLTGTNFRRDAKHIVREFSHFDNNDIDSIAKGLELMEQNGIDYADGIDEAEKGLLNKMITDLTNEGKITEALAKKTKELADFLVQQNARG